MRHREEPITMIAGAATDSLGPVVTAHLATAKHRLALIDRRGKEIRDLAASTEGKAASVRVQTGDVMHPRRIKHFLDDMLIHYGRVDNVVFVPDHVAFAPFLSTTEEDLEAHLDLSLRGPWRWLHAAIPSMVEHGGGRIIFISAAADRALGRVSAFHAAKGALQALVESVALEHHKDGVRPVCVVLDGLLDEPRMRAALPDHKDWSDAITLDQVGAAVHALVHTPLDDIPPQVLVRPLEK